MAGASEKSGEIARWNKHRFISKRKHILGFTDLQIKASSETEEKTGSKQKFVSRKNSKPTEISLNAILDARLGCDVKKEAMSFVSDAYNGLSDWLYIGAKKLVTCKVMLVDATVRDIVLTSKGKWISAQVALSFRQCTQDNGSTDVDSDTSKSTGSGGGGNTGSAPKKETVKSDFWKKPVETVNSTLQKVESFKLSAKVNAALNEIKKRKAQAQKVLPRKNNAAGGTKLMRTR